MNSPGCCTLPLPPSYRPQTSAYPSLALSPPPQLPHACTEDVDADLPLPLRAFLLYPVSD